MARIDFSTLPEITPGEEAASTRQKAYLRHLGGFPDEDLDRLGKWQASALIDSILESQGESGFGYRPRRSSPRRSGALGKMLISLASIGLAYFAAKWAMNRTAAKLGAPPPPGLTTKVPPQPARPAVPLFQNVQRSLQLVRDAGLEGYGGKPPEWSHSERGWYSVAKKSGPLAADGAIEWQIMCIQNSQDEKRIESVQWVLKEREDSTIAPHFFRDVCMTYCGKLGCDVPPGLFADVDPVRGQVIDTKAAKFEVRKQRSELGSGWALTITGKN